jgi:5'-nucleotidase
LNDATLATFRQISLIRPPLSFPFEDPVVVIKVSGKAIVEALENGVSTYPALEGRFPQVSGISFTFNPALPKGQRIVQCAVDSKPVDPKKLYKLTTRGYMARGKDGYTSLLIQSEGGEAEEIVDEENGVLISTIVRQFFMALRVVDKWKLWGDSMQNHWNTVVHGMENASSPVVSPTKKKPSALPAHVLKEAKAGGNIAQDSDAEPIDEPIPMPKYCKNDREEILIRRILRKWRRLAGVRHESDACDAMGIEEFQVSWTKVGLNTSS